MKKVQGPTSKVQSTAGAEGGEQGEENISDRILKIPVICIGPTTALVAEEAGFSEIYFPDQYTAEGMVDELLVISAKLK